MLDTLFADPIKVPLDTKTGQTLKEDAEFFQLGSIHQFSKFVIKKSYKSFLKTLAEKQKKLKKELSLFLKDSDLLEQTLQASKRVFLSFEDTKEIKSKKDGITLRINQDELFEFSTMYREYVSTGIEQVHGFSSFLRILLFQYTRLSRIEREQLLFETSYDAILNAIRNNVILHLQLRDQTLMFVLPYKIVRFGDECHFLVGDDTVINETVSIRLSRIVHLSTDVHNSNLKVRHQTMDLVAKYEQSSFQYSAMGNQLDDNQILESLLFLQEMSGKLTF